MDYSYQYSFGQNPAVDIVSIALCVLILVAEWKAFAKAGRPGWACIVPFYNMYVMFQIAFGEDKGIRFLMLLIPFYNIYLLFKFCIALAKSYGKSAGFGVGMVFLGFVFWPILGLGDAEYEGAEDW